MYGLNVVQDTFGILVGWFLLHVVSVFKYIAIRVFMTMSIWYTSYNQVLLI